MLRLSLEALQIIDAIDRRGSFSKAGEELHRVPSTISYTVGKLEDELAFVFAVAPGHPLAALPEPLGRAQLQDHRAVVVADSARRLAPRTVGLLLGQDALTVPTMQDKYAFQLGGLGFGFLPEPCARG